MKELLKKDYLTNRFIFTVMLLIACAGVIILSFIKSEISILIGVLGSVFIPFMANKMSSTEEMRKHYDLVMNSFPIKRSDIVISRYIYYIIILLISAVVLVPITIIFNSLEGFDIKILMLIECLLFAYYVLLCVIPNTIYYCTEYERAAKYLSIIMVTILYIPPVVIGVIFNASPSLQVFLLNIITNGGSRFIILLLCIILIAIVVYVAGILISIVGYKRRDLN